MSRYDPEDIVQRFKQNVNRQLRAESIDPGREGLEPKSIRSDRITNAVLLAAALHPDGYAQDETSLHEMADNVDVLTQVVVTNVMRSGGLLVRSLGLILICAFGAPPVAADGPHALNALQAVKDISANLDSWNRQRAAQSKSVINAGYGLVYGKVLGGNRGAGQFVSYELIGGSIYLAITLANVTKDGQCFANAEFFAEIATLKDSYPAHQLKLTNGTIHTVYRIYP